MVLVQAAGKDGDEVYIAILDFPDLAEYLDHHSENVSILPMKLSKLLEDFIQRFLVEVAVDHLANVQLHRCSLLFHNSYAVWRISLIVSIFDHQCLSIIQMLHVLFAHHNLELNIIPLVFHRSQILVTQSPYHIAHANTSLWRF